MCVRQPVDFMEMALLQLACPDVQAMRKRTSLKISQEAVGDQVLVS
jgi:hypothetical protein